MEFLHDKKRYSVLGSSSSFQHSSKKCSRKNSALMENIQKYIIDSKENKIFKNNNPPRTNLPSIKKLKKKKISEKIQKIIMKI